MPQVATWTPQALWSVPREWPWSLFRFVTERCMDRFRESAFYGPTISETLLYSSPAKSCPGSPIGDTQSLAIQGQVSILGCIARLFVLRGPLAIIRRISAVVIYALNRHTRRALSHVGQEILKCLPSFTHLNTTSTVFVEVERFRIAASRLHCRPNLVFSRSEPDSITSMCCAPFKMDASATLGVTVHQVTDERDGIFAAVAMASPRTITYGFNNRESAEPLAAVILGCWMKLNWGYSAVSHAVSSHDGDDVVRGCRSLVTAVSLAFNYPTCVEVAA